MTKLLLILLIAFLLLVGVYIVKHTRPVPGKLTAPIPQQYIVPTPRASGSAIETALPSGK